MSLGATRVQPPEDVSPTIPMTIALGQRRMGQFEDWYDVPVDVVDPGFDIDPGITFDPGYDLGFDPTLDVPADVFEVPTDIGGDNVLAQAEWETGWGTNPDGSVTDANGDTWYDDGTIIRANGDIQLPSGLVTDGQGNLWDASGNKIADAATPMVDPETGAVTTSGDVLKTTNTLLDLTAKAAGIFRAITGQAAPTAAAGRPVPLGNGMFRLPNGQTVQGVKLPNGQYKLPDGSVVGAASGGLFGSVGMGTIGLLAVGGLALVLFMRK